MATVQSAPPRLILAIASVAHEVKQPLAAIELYAGTSLRWLARQQPALPSTTGAGTNHPGSQAGRRRRQPRSGVDKKIAPKKELLDLNEIILGVVALMRSQQKSSTLRSTRDCRSTCLPCWPTASRSRRSS